MKLALVTGATGFVGTHLCRELINNGYRVRAIHRASSKITHLQTMGVELVLGDVTDPDSLHAAMREIDVVFHIAALYREAKFGDNVYWKVNFEGTRNVLEAARTAGVRKLIHCSTIGVHSHIEKPLATESEPYAPTDVYQESKTEAEKLALEWFQNGKISGAVIRPAMIWGPGDTRFLKMFKGIAYRKLPLIGEGKIFCHWILVTDLVRAFRLAAETNRSDGQVYIIAGERAVTLRYTMECIAKIYGTRLLPFNIPVTPFQIIGSIVEAICKPFGIEPPIHRRRADFFIKNRAFDCSKAKSELGFIATNRFEDEVELVAKWYVENGWISLPASSLHSLSEASQPG